MLTLIHILLGLTGVVLMHVAKEPGRIPNLFAGCALYVLSYDFLAFLGQEGCCAVNAIGQPRQAAWAFQTLRQSRFEDNVKERALFLLYFPLIRMDRMNGYHHILDGGDKLLSC